MSYTIQFGSFSYDEDFQREYMLELLTKHYQDVVDWLDVKIPKYEFFALEYFVHVPTPAEDFVITGVPFTCRWQCFVFLKLPDSSAIQWKLRWNDDVTLPHIHSKRKKYGKKLTKLDLFQVNLNIAA